MYKKLRLLIIPTLCFLLSGCFAALAAGTITGVSLALHKHHPKVEKKSSKVEKQKHD